MSENLVSNLTNLGVAVGVLVWFMLRMEKKLDDLTAVIAKLCEKVA